MQVADAGPGIAPVYSASAPPPPAGPDTFAQTFYANSPLGLRPDLVAGPLVNGSTGTFVDTGTPLRKFVDILPGIPGLAPTTNAGTGVIGSSAKYIPIAAPGKWPGDGADYYHIAVVEYTEQMHSDLPKATTLRGYVQIEEPGQPQPAASKHIQLFYPNGTPMTLPDASGAQQPVFAYDNPHYLGPTIVATKDKAVRVKYSNLLPIGGASDAFGNGVPNRNGDLPLPVDETLPSGSFLQNRIDVHLHGGFTPWISDGTPHQWTIPVGETRYGYLSDIAVTAVGSAYPAGTLLYIDPPQSVATATATVTAGTVSAINVVQPGAHYTSSTATVLIDPPPGAQAGGATAAGTAVLGGAAGSTSLASITVASAGSGYVVAPLVTVAPPPPASAANPVATLNTTGGVGAVTASIPGAGYLNACVVGSTGPNCSYATVSAPAAAVPATATATVAAATGVLTVSAPSAGNFGYWANPTSPAVTLTPAAPPAAVAATAMAAYSATSGSVSSLTLAPTPANFGYWAANNPAVTISAPPSAVAATSTATINAATHGVAGLSINAGNFGYWAAPSAPNAAPSVAIAAPPAAVQATTGAVTVGNVTVTSRNGTTTTYGALTALPLGTGGYGYWTAPAVTVAAPPATVAATAATSISAVNGQLSLTPNANFGYWVLPQAITVAAPPAPFGVANAALRGVVGTGANAGKIVAISGLTANFGYWTAPTVTIAAPGGAGVRVRATAVANIANGRIVGFTITNPGSGYGAAPNVGLGNQPTQGTRARVTATLTGGAIVGLTVTGGTGYDPLNPPTVTFAAPTPGAQATAVARINATGNVTGYTITAEGSGYATAPAVTIGAPTPSVTATAVPTLVNGSITGFTLTPGMNYLAAPAVTISAPAASVPASAKPVLANGSITGFTLSGGQNYNAAPAVTISAPVAGTPATVVANLGGGSITSFTVTGGTGYNPTVPVTVAIAAPAPSVNAQVQLTVVNGVITAYTVTTAGSGYATVPTVSLIPLPATAPAAATATVAGGVVTGFTVTSAGSGYIVPPTITVAAPPLPLQATATANVDAKGAIAGFTITNPGAGYLTAPKVTLGWPAGAVQATASPVITGGAITGVTLTNAGGGYLSVPQVTIGSGLGCAVTAANPMGICPPAAGSGGAVNALVVPPVGPSFAQVPDMTGNASVIDASGATVPYVAPIVGEGTLYYTNNQSERLMWYHDHAAGITRLNVYMGLAAPFLLTDPAVDPVLPGQAPAGGALQGYVPEEQIPLVIQERTFVPKDIAQQDVNWDSTHWGQNGDFWFPHVYETNQNPAFLRSLSNLGRWDWGPWFAIVYPALYALPTGKYGDVTTTPEAYQDTMMVNGAAFPTLTVEPRAYRLRILNASNDRFMNLGFYLADGTQARSGGPGYPGDNAVNVEVKQVSNIGDQPGTIAGAAPSVFQLPGNTGLLPWPTDGRIAPSPDTMGPPMIEIGNEGGLLPQWVQHDPVPVNYDYNRRSVTVLNVSQNGDPTQACYPECHGLYMGPAERADVVVDFAPYAGKTLILYNDAPAPNPAYDTRIDYYTDNDPTNTVNYMTGGAPNTLAGYGPNTRTILQVVVKTAQSTPVDYVKATGPAVNGNVTWNPNALGAGRVLSALTTNTPGVIQATYAATQAPPIVGESAYNIAFNSGYTDQYGNMYLASQNQPEFYVTNPGPLTLTGIVLTGQTTSTGAASGVGLGSGSTGTNAGAGSGTGYTVPPAVLITPPGCLGSGTQTVACATATATATVSGGQVTGVTLTNPGAGYTEVPGVTFVAGGSLTALSITNGGSGYSAATPPVVTLTGGGGTGATAAATVNAAGVVSGLTITSAGSGYSTSPTVSIAPPAVVAASGTAVLAGGSVSAVTISNGGLAVAGSVPTVSFSAAPAGSPAVITATEVSASGTYFVVGFNIVSSGSGYALAPAISTPCGGSATTTLNASGGIASVTLTGIGLNGTTCLASEPVSLSTTPVPGVTATGTAVMDATGTIVTGVALGNPGSGYLAAPAVTFSGGVQATASAAASGGGYGATAIAVASTTQAFVAPAAIPGNLVPPTPNAVPITLSSGLSNLLGCTNGALPCSNLNGAVIGRLMNPAIQELFEPFYGRMNATLGIEMPNQSLTVQTTLPLNYVDPATEMWEYNKPVMWKITHNGVDAHPVHFHLVNVQVVNRVGWDGTVKAPEDDEIGWKETVKMNPLEDIIVVMKPTMPQVPFGVDKSVRPQDPSQPLGVNLGFTQFTTQGFNGGIGNQLASEYKGVASAGYLGGALGVGEPATVVNSLENYDNEYVWHCHILGHEENDFMRPIAVISSPVAPPAPTGVTLSQAAAGQPVVISWTDPTPVAAYGTVGNTTFGNQANELGFIVQRATSAAGPWTTVATAPANATTASDLLYQPVASGTTYYYQVFGYNASVAGNGAASAAASITAQ
jgi:FtsP/CotA-like multicopper oxidase with cupredoxin domain